jgi:hypothetical protein
VWQKLTVSCVREIIWIRDSNRAGNRATQSSMNSTSHSMMRPTESITGHVANITGVPDQECYLQLELGWNLRASTALKTTPTLSRNTEHCGIGHLQSSCDLKPLSLPSSSILELPRLHKLAVDRLQLVLKPFKSSAGYLLLFAVAIN